MAGYLAGFIILAAIGVVSYSILSDNSDIVAAISSKQDQPVNAEDVQGEEIDDSLKARIKVDYIEFEAVVITETNYEKLNKEWDGGLSVITEDSDKTIVLLGLSNHRQNLEEFDYSALAVLNDQQAENWQMLSSTMGGHHVEGILTFPATLNPQDLIIGGLPVGEASLIFNRSSDET